MREHGGKDGTTGCGVLSRIAFPAPGLRRRRPSARGGLPGQDPSGDRPQLPSLKITQYYKLWCQAERARGVRPKSATIDYGLMFKFMFSSATVSASVHVRAGQGGKHCSYAVTSGRAAVVFQPKKIVAGNVDNEGQQHNAGLQPAPDCLDNADINASQLQEAAAKTAK
jgi:hypothetical protein